MIKKKSGKNFLKKKIIKGFIFVKNEFNSKKILQKKNHQKYSKNNQGRICFPNTLENTTSYKTLHEK